MGGDLAQRVCCAWGQIGHALTTRLTPQTDSTNAQFLSLFTHEWDLLSLNFCSKPRNQSIQIDIGFLDNGCPGGNVACNLFAELLRCVARWFNAQNGQSLFDRGIL